VGCHEIAEVLSSVSPFKKGWESLLYKFEKLFSVNRDDRMFMNSNMENHG
jgi:hypothetical protein